MVPPASVQMLKVSVLSTPDDHLIASPDGSVIESPSGRGGGAGGCPSVRVGIVSPAGVHIPCGVIFIAGPDDHFTAAPDYCVSGSGSGRVGGAGGCPTIRAGIVLTAAVAKTATGALTLSAPDDHFTASPDCSVSISAIRRVGDAGGCPTIRTGIVPPASVQIVVTIESAPDDHFTARPHCSVSSSASGCVGDAGGCPTIRDGIVY